MSHYYFDASALVKRYLHETGTRWVHGLTDPKAGNTIVIAQVTQVEMAAAFASRHRAPGGISRTMRDRIIQLLRNHCVLEYRLIPLNPGLIRQAVDLTQRHRLRGYDAVQLATALDANRTLNSIDGFTLTFVAADNDLLAAAQAEGLLADNPNLHP